MDLIPIDRFTWYPNGDVIDNYTSLIWTERYRSCGDFELKTPYVDETMKLMPTGSIVSLQDTREMMIVETHTIAPDDDDIRTLTTTGRSFESVLESRALVNGYAPLYDTSNKTTWTAAEVVKKIINERIGGRLITGHYDALENVAVVDLTVTGTLTDTYPPWNPEGWEWDMGDYPDLSVGGDIYNFIQDYLNRGLLGIKTMRRLPGTSDDPNATRAIIGLYYGKNRKRDQPTMLGYTPSEPVIFSYEQEHFNNTSYVFSQKDFRNVAYVNDGGDATIVYAPGTESTVAEFNRRVLQVDGAGLDATEARQKGLLELAKHNQRLIFDGEISPDCPYVYNKDYGLGDVVDLDAEFGYLGSMQVTEYIRNESDAGETGYPTLTALGDGS